MDTATVRGQLTRVRWDFGVLNRGRLVWCPAVEPPAVPRLATRRALHSRMADADDASNPRAKVSELSAKVVDTNPYSRLMCAGRLRHACCAAD